MRPLWPRRILGCLVRRRELGVTVDNIAGFMAMPEIDGALVGGASLKPDFVELVRRAVRAAGRPR